MSYWRPFRFSPRILRDFHVLQSGLRITAILAILASLLSVAYVPQVQAQPNLTITPITWNIVGLDSNNVNVGPNNFPVGARVCNIGDAPATHVTAQFVWDSGDSYIDLRHGSLVSMTVPSLAGNNTCTDFYFEVSVTRNSAAYNHTRRYHIQVTADGGISLSTPTPREIYVEHLISQSRNATLDVRLNGVSVPSGGTMALVVGQTYTITLLAQTATNGYEQIETFVNFPNTIFRVDRVQTTYTANDTVSPDPDAPTKLYADGCTWENDPNSPNYRSCLDTGKYGGNVVVTYTVTIIGGAGTTEKLHTLIYDFSGSSYHYNADFSANYRIAAIVDPSILTIAKNFSPDPMYVGGVSRLTLTVNNPNSGAVSGVNFTDTLPSPLVIASPPNVSISGCGSPTVTAINGTTTITATNITVGASGSCVIGVNVTSPATGTFTNTTGPLYVGAINTGSVATDTLTVSSDPPPPPPPITCATPVTLALWTFENYTASQQTQNGPFNASYQAPDISNARGVYGASGASASGIANPTTCPSGWQCPSGGNTGNSWGIRGGWPAGPIMPDGSTVPYFQFEVHDADRYGGVGFAANYNLRGNWSGAQGRYLFILFSTDGVNWSLAHRVTYSQNVWASVITTTTSTGNNHFYFRVIADGAQYSGGSTTAVMYLDNIRIFGCERVNLAPPTLTKAFLSNPVAVGGTSTLVFTLSHTNSVTLTGATFSDSLPAGLQVANPPNLVNNCGGTVSGAVAGSTAITLTGGIIPPNGSCTLRVDVTATTAGPHLNVTGILSTTETGPDGYGSDTLTALVPPTIEKTFIPNPIVAGMKTTLIFNITNPNVDAQLTGVAFTDTFPSGVVVATPPNASTSGCGSPTFNPIAGDGSISFSGGTIAAGGTCTARVDVTAPAGVYTNTTGPVTANITGGTDTATDTLMVRAPNPSLSLQKQIATSLGGPWRNFVAVTSGQHAYYRFVVENTGDITLTNVVVTDTTLGDLSACSWVNGNGLPLTMPFTLPVAGADEGHIAYCAWGPVSAQTGWYTNTATADSAQTEPVTDTATYATVSLTLEKSAAEPYFVNAGDVLHYTYVVTNTGYAPLQGPVVVTDTRTTVTCPPVTTVVPDGDNFLDPGEAITCTATYTVTADDGAAGYVTNVARATVEGFFSNEDRATVPASTSADLSLEKVASTVTPYVGSAVVFTITVHNAGPATATGVTVSDTLPAGLTYVSHSGDGSYDHNTGMWTVGTIHAGASASLVITATVNTANPVTNIAQVQTSAQIDPDSTPGNNVPAEDDYDSVTLTPQYIVLDLVKTASPMEVEPGGYLTYTVTVINAGNTPATGVLITDVVPLNTTFVTATVPHIGPDAGNVITWALGTLGVGASREVTMLVQVDSPLLNGVPITNTAWVTSTEGVTDTGTVIARVVSAHALNIAKSVAVSPVQAGGLLTYTINWEVTGNEPAFGVTISDTVPVSTTYQGCEPVGICSESGGLVTWNLGNVNPPASGIVTLTVRVDSPLVNGVLLYNTAAITDTSGLSDTDTLPTPVASAHVLNIAKTADPSPVQAGGLLTYTINWQVTGNEPAFGVVIRDTVPVSTTYVACSGGLSCSESGGLVTWNLGNVNPPASGVVTLTVRVDSPLVSGVLLYNTVTITDTSGLSATHTLPTPVASAHVLNVFKTAAPSPVQAGGLLTYTINWQVTGNEPAFGVTISDTVPVSTTYQGCEPVGICSESGGLVTWNLGNVNPPASGVVTLTVQANSPLISGTLLYNAVVITDVSGLSDTDTTQTPVESGHALNIAKGVASSPVQAGGLLTYTIHWEVTGNEPAFGVTISDTVPVSTTYQGCEPVGICSESGGLVTWNLGNVNPPASGIVTLTVRVDSPLVNGVLLYNTATITDTSGLSDTDTIQTPVASAHVLNVFKTAAPSPVQAGGLLTYTIHWEVTGNEPAFGVTISDTVPVSTTYVACDGGLSCSESGGLVTWNLGNVNPPASGVVTLTVRADSPLVSGVLLYNTVTITDTSGLSATHTLPTPVASAHVLSVFKTAAPSPVQAGGLLTYTIHWEVTGNEPAFGVTISDTVPVSTTYQGCEPVGICSESGGLVTWDLGDVNPPAAGVVTLTVRVDSPLVSGVPLYNTATITDTSGLSDTDTIQTPVVSAHALNIAKTAEPSPVQAGGLLTYTINWQVTGNEPAFGVTIRDAVPVNTTFVTATLPHNLVGNTVLWNLGDQYPPASGVLTLVVQVNSPLISGTLLYNAAVITDTSGLISTGPVTTPVESAPVLNLVKSSTDVNGAPLRPGDRLTYTIIVSNTGNETATGVTVRDTVPAYTTYVPGSIAGGDSRSDVGPLLLWTINSLPPGGAATLSYAVTVNFPLMNGLQIVNTATVTCTQVPTPITDTVTDTVTASHTLDVAKSAFPPVVRAGDLLTYTLTYTITGDEPVYGVVVSDTTPANTTFWAAIPPAASTPGVGGTGPVIWNLGIFLPPESGITQTTGSLTLVVLVDSPLVSGTVLYNAATISDISGITDTDEVTTPVESIHALSVDKTADPTAVPETGGLVTFTFTVTNTGTVTTTILSLTDSAFAPLTGDADCQVGTVLFPGQSCSFVYTTTLSGPAGSAHTNIFTATAQEATGNTVSDSDDATVDFTDVLPQIAVDKVAEPTVVPETGGVVTFTFTVTNTGTVTAVITSLTDDRFGTLGGDADCQVGTVLLPGQSCSFTYTTTLSGQARTSHTNTFTATAEDADGNADSDSDDATVDFTDVLPQIAVSKVADPTTVPETGGAVTFTFTVTNTGMVTVVITSLSDDVFGTLSGDADCRVGTVLLPGQSCSFAYTTTLSGPAGTSHTNTFTAEAEDADGNADSDSDDATVDFTDVLPQIAVSKAAEPTAVPEAGGVVTFTFTVTNTGTVTVTITELTDSVFGTLSGDADCQVGTALLTGQSCSFVYTTTLSGPAGSTHTNIFTGTARDADGNPASDSDDATVDFLSVPGLVIEKSVIPGEAVRNMPFTYTIRITNTGQVAFDPLVLTDTLPADFHYVVGSGSPSDPDVIAEPTLVWANLGPLAPGESITVSFAVTATPGITGTYWNVALVGGEYPGGVLTDTDDAPVAIVDPAVAVDKQLVAADLDDVEPNYVTFTIAITNVGVSTINVLPLVDQYDPYYLSFVWAEPSPNEPADDGLLTWYDLTGDPPYGFGRNLAPGESFVITTVFSVVHDITTTVNTAAVSDVVDVYANPANEDEDEAVVANIPTAVELLYFRVGGVANRSVRLEWATAVEIGTFGFKLYRAPVADFARATLVDFVPSEARGGGATYVYTDTVPSDGLWWYWLAEVDVEGRETRYGPVSAAVGAAALPYRVYLPLVLR